MGSSVICNACKAVLDNIASKAHHTYLPTCTQCNKPTNEVGFNTLNMGDKFLFGGSRFVVWPEIKFSGFDYNSIVNCVEERIYPDAYVAPQHIATYIIPTQKVYAC